MDYKREEIAKLLIMYNGILFDSVGFKLKLHETNPDAPLSPFYIDLRGLVRDPFVQEKLINFLYDFIFWTEIGYFDYIVDIPLSISPLAALLAKRLEKPLLTPRLNVKDYGKKDAILGNYSSGGSVLLIDDVLTKADTKIKVVNLLSEVGLSVRGLIVLVDREQGGCNQLIEEKVRVFSVFKWTELCNFYFDKGYISGEIFTRVGRYLGWGRHD